MSALFLIIVSLILSSRTEWISSLPSRLPKSDKQMAVVYFNRTLFLLGGWYHRRSVIKYDVENDLLVSYNNNTLSADTMGRSYYSQIGNILYMISDHGTNINTYNLLTNQFTINSLTNNIPMEVGIDGCLTLINNELYITGGWMNGVTFDAVQIFTVSSDSWRFGPPMLQPRYAATCQVSSVTNKLYAIGGSLLATVEFISVVDIDANTWRKTPNDLSQGLAYSASVLFEPFIYAISGYNGSHSLPIVHIIDTTTNEVSLASDEMVYGAADTSPIIVGKRLYAFGGRIVGDRYSNAWQYSDLTGNPNTSEATPTLALKNPPFIPTLFATEAITHSSTWKPTTNLIESTSNPLSLNEAEVAIPSSTIQQTNYVSITPTKKDSNLLSNTFIIISVVMVSIGVLFCILYLIGKNRNLKNLIHPENMDMIVEHVKNDDEDKHDVKLEENPTTPQFQNNVSPKINVALQCGTCNDVSGVVLDEGEFIVEGDDEVTAGSKPYTEFVVQGGASVLIQSEGDIPDITSCADNSDGTTKLNGESVSK